jgi:hypothetical protein
MECRKRQRDLKTSSKKDHGDGKSNSDRTAYLGSGFSGAVISSLDEMDGFSTSFYFKQHDSDIRFLLDLGATEHLCGDRTVFSNIRRLSTRKEFRMVNGTAYAEEVGDIVVEGSAAGNVTFRNVHYLPNSPNLLSYGTLLNKGWDSSCRGQVVSIGEIAKIPLYFALNRTNTPASTKITEIPLSLLFFPKRVFFG